MFSLGSGAQDEGESKLWFHRTAWSSLASCYLGPFPLLQSGRAVV